MEQLYEILKEIKRIEKIGYIKCNNNSYKFKLEHLMNDNNFTLEKINIKTKILNNNRKYISLFNATPNNSANDIKRILEIYGSKDKTFPKFKVFNAQVSSKLRKINNHFFVLEVNYKLKKVILNIYNLKGELIDKNCFWTFNSLEERIYNKLTYLICIKVDKLNINNNTYIKYFDENLYKFKSFKNFLKLIEDGKIRFSFSIDIFKDNKRFGQLHDHGTHIEINKDYFDVIFDKITF